MDVELRAVRKAFKIRGFEACYVEAMDETAARQGVPWRLPNCAPALLSTRQGFLDKLLPLGRARPRGPLKVSLILLQPRRWASIAAASCGKKRAGRPEEVGALRTRSGGARDHSLSATCRSALRGPGQGSAKTVLVCWATLQQSALP